MLAGEWARVRTEVKDVGAAVRNRRAWPVQAGAVFPALQVAVAVLFSVEGRLGAVGVAARSNSLRQTNRSFFFDGCFIKERIGSSRNRNRQERSRGIGTVKPRKMAWGKPLLRSLIIAVIKVTE